MTAAMLPRSLAPWRLVLSVGPIGHT